MNSMALVQSPPIFKYPRPAVVSAITGIKLILSLHCNMRDSMSVHGYLGFLLIGTVIRGQKR